MSSIPQFVPFLRPEAEACEYLGPERVVWSKGNVLSISRDATGPTLEVARLPRPYLRRLLGLTRLGRRLGREMFYTVQPAGEYLFYCFGNEVGWLRDGTFVAIGGRARPSKVLRDAVARMPDGALVFGEYFGNPDRAAVHIYRVSPGAAEATIVHRFAPGEIRHVHRCAWDPIEGRVIVATGDVGDECRLISFDPEFGDCEVLGKGGEDWRVISSQFTDDAIYFGTDAEFQTNTIRRLDRADRSVSVLAETNGPIFQSLQIDGGIVFFSAAELSPCQTSPEAIAYWLDLASHEVRPVRRWAKDSLPKRYFQFGMVAAPIIDGSPRTVPVSGIALRGLEGRFEALCATA